MYSVVDCYDYARENVAIAMSFMDRYLALITINATTNHHLSYHTTYQLTAITSLFLAIKINESASIKGILKISSLLKLCGGLFSSHHVLEMERNILQTLQWKVCPCTPMLYIREFGVLPCWQESTKDANAISIRNEVFETSQFMSEVSICDSYFISKKPSSIALACLRVAFEIHQVHAGTVLHHACEEFMTQVERFAGIGGANEEVLVCMDRLKRLCELYEPARLNVEDQHENSVGKTSSSPVSHLEQDKMEQEPRSGKSPDQVAHHMRDDENPI